MLFGPGKKEGLKRLFYIYFAGNPTKVVGITLAVVWNNTLKTPPIVKDRFEFLHILDRNKALRALYLFIIIPVQL